MPTDLTICPFCNAAVLEWRDEKEDSIVCPGCGAVLLEVVEVDDD